MFRGPGSDDAAFAASVALIPSTGFFGGPRRSSNNAVSPAPAGAGGGASGFGGPAHVDDTHVFAPGLVLRGMQPAAGPAAARTAWVGGAPDAPAVAPPPGVSAARASYAPVNSEQQRRQ